MRYYFPPAGSIILIEPKHFVSGCLPDSSDRVIRAGNVFQAGKPEPAQYILEM
jgi:hypothetical protein